VLKATQNCKDASLSCHWYSRENSLKLPRCRHCFHMIRWQPLNCHLAGLQPACSCLLPASKTTALAGSQAVAVSRDVLALVPCIQLQVCEYLLKSPEPWGVCKFILQISAEILISSCCLFQDKFYISTTSVTTPGVEAKDFKLVRLVLQGTRGPSAKSCLGCNRVGSQPRQQLSCRDEEFDMIFLSVQETGSWHGKWHSFPFLH